MINDLKFVLKMLKYAYQLKLNKICALVILALGSLMVICNCLGVKTGEAADMGMFMAGFYFALPAMFLEQLWQGMNVSIMLQTSPKHQKAQVTIPVMLLLAGQLVVYTIVCLIMMVSKLAGRMDTAYFNGQLLMLAIVLAIIQLYSAACYKYFAAATVVFMVVLPTFMIGGMDVILMYLKVQGSILLSSAPAAVLLSYGILFAGGVLSYLLTYLLRNKPISKFAAGAALRRYM